MRSSSVRNRRKRVVGRASLGQQFGTGPRTGQAMLALLRVEDERVSRRAGDGAV
jgi:hypothetical protein